MNKSLFFLSILVLFAGNKVFSQKIGKPTKIGKGFNSLNNVQNDSLRSSNKVKITLSGETSYTD